ncbi:MAG: metal-dependent transcriptional regulator [Thermoanaerobaculia bacterium]
MATSTVEDYLKAILLEEEREPGSPVATGRLATLLTVTPGTVTAMLKTLADSGLVAYEPYAGGLLTTAGRQLALHVLRRHRLIELFLVQIVGLDWSEVHEEAERLEHAVSERLIERMDEMLDRPAVDPHGDPIPTAALKVQTLDYSTLADLGAGEIGLRCRVARIADQSPEFLRLVEKVGLRPGRKVRVTARDEAADTLEIELDRGRRASLGLRAAGKIFVERV